MYGELGSGTDHNIIFFLLAPIMLWCLKTFKCCHNI